MSTLLISQDDVALKVEERYGFFATNKVSYAFDGQRSSGQMLMGRMATFAPAQIASHWKDGQLVSLFTVTVPGEERPRRYQQTLSLDPEGKLVVHLERVSTPHSRTTIYKK